MTNQSEDPVAAANEADVVEQTQEADGSGTVTAPDVTTDEANEADALEQGANVDADDDAYPHRAEEDVE